MKARLTPAQVERFPIVGLDPGETIGVCRATLTLATDPPQVLWETFNLRWPHQAQQLSNLVCQEARTIVLEGFRLFPQIARQGSLTYNALVPIEVIGFVRGIVTQLGNYLPEGELTLVEQLSAIKATWSDAVVKDMVRDDYPRGPHQRDAMRHILAYLARVEDAT